MNELPGLTKSLLRIAGGGPSTVSVDTPSWTRRNLLEGINVFALDDESQEG